MIESDHGKRTTKPKVRRTQEERREGTIRKLLDAAAATLIDEGYSEASVQAICARAGVSQGALFRHFPTREALMAATGADIGRKMLTSFQSEFEALRGTEDPLPLAVRLLREHCRSRLNQGWYELAMAARTHESLRQALAPAAIGYYIEIELVGRALLPDLAARLGDRFPVLLETILSLFDGESVHRFIVPNDAFDEARTELILALVRSFR